MARIRLIVEVECAAAWGDGCTIEQVHEQAEDYAVQRLKTAVEGVGQIIAVETTTAIITKEGRR